MKNSFQFRSQLETSRENLAQPATFLPSERAVAWLTKELYRPKTTHLQGFGGILIFNSAKNVMAQPLLKGDLQ